MDSLLAIGIGVCVRLVIDSVSNDDFRITGSLVGLWEGVVLYHFLYKSPRSTDPYIAYAVRLFIDYLVTDSLYKLSLVLLWTALGLVLADIAPFFWYDLRLAVILRRFRRDLSVLGLRVSSRSSTPNRVRFHSPPLPPPPPLRSIFDDAISEAPLSPLAPSVSVSSASDRTITPTTISRARSSTTRVPGSFPDDASDITRASDVRSTRYARTIDSTDILSETDDSASTFDPDPSAENPPDIPEEDELEYVPDTNRSDHDLTPTSHESPLPDPDDSQQPPQPADVPDIPDMDETKPPIIFHPDLSDSPPIPDWRFPPSPANLNRSQVLSRISGDPLLFPPVLDTEGPPVVPPKDPSPPLVYRSVSPLRDAEKPHPVTSPAEVDLLDMHDSPISQKHALQPPPASALPPTRPPNQPAAPEENVAPKSVPSDPLNRNSSTPGIVVPVSAVPRTYSPAPLKNVVPAPIVPPTQTAVPPNKDIPTTVTPPTQSNETPAAPNNNVVPPIQTTDPPNNITAASVHPPVQSNQTPPDPPADVLSASAPPLSQLEQTTAPPENVPTASSVPQTSQTPVPLENAVSAPDVLPQTNQTSAPPENVAPPQAVPPPQASETPPPQQPLPPKELAIDLRGAELDDAIRRLETALTDAFTPANGWTTLKVRCPPKKANKTRFQAVKLLKERHVEYKELGANILEISVPRS